MGWNTTGGQYDKVQYGILPSYPLIDISSEHLKSKRNKINLLQPCTILLFLASKYSICTSPYLNPPPRTPPPHQPTPRLVIINFSGSVPRIRGQKEGHIRYEKVAISRSGPDNSHRITTTYIFFLLLDMMGIYSSSGS